MHLALLDSYSNSVKKITGICTTLHSWSTNSEESKKCGRNNTLSTKPQYQESSETASSQGNMPQWQHYVLQGARSGSFQMSPSPICYSRSLREISWRNIAHGKAHPGAGTLEIRKRKMTRQGSHERHGHRIVCGGVGRHGTNRCKGVTRRGWCRPAWHAAPHGPRKAACQ